MTDERLNKSIDNNKHYIRILQNNLKRLHYSKQSFIRPATQEEDEHEGCDIIIIPPYSRKVRVAVRQRDMKYHKYKDITIRTYNCGGQTEVDKAHFTDIMLYGWADDRQFKYYLIDASKIYRLHLLDHLPTIDNDDDSSFAYISIATLIHHDCLLSPELTYLFLPSTETRTCQKSNTT